MLRKAAILCLLLGRAAFAEDAAAPAGGSQQPVSEARQALLERAAAPSATARLPVLGIDPLRRAGNALKTSPALPAASAHRSPRTLPQSGADRARDPADRAADRALRGDDHGPGGHGPGRRGPGEGRHDDHDGRRDDHDGPPPGGGGPPPHPP